jgi:hypothetical protein
VYQSRRQEKPNLLLQGWETLLALEEEGHQNLLILQKSQFFNYRLYKNSGTWQAVEVKYSIPVMEAHIENHLQLHEAVCLRRHNAFNCHKYLNLT